MKLENRGEYENQVIKRQPILKEYR